MTSTEPSPPPDPNLPPLLPHSAPVPPDWEFNPDGTVNLPDYPPHVPESQFDTSQGVPRSALDGIHGTTDDEPVLWKPSFPGDLPPYWMHDYYEDPNNPGVWYPDHRPSPPGSTHPAAYHADQKPPGDEKDADQAGRGDGHLNVNPADLHKAADDYAELRARAAAIGPQAVDEVNRIIATHGVMGYPVAVGVVAGLARRQAQVEAKAAQFGVYSERFTEHGATYVSEDKAGAARMGGMEFESVGFKSSGP